MAKKQQPFASSPTEQKLLVVTVEDMKGWRSPPFQRPIRINDKVREYAEEVQQERGIMAGTAFQLGVWEDETYLVDGQHRREAVYLSGLKEVLVRAEITSYEDGVKGIVGMAETYRRCNGRLVSLRPDDTLKALEISSPPLQLVRSECPFVGYDMIRRSEKTPMLSMAVTLRCWRASSGEVPAMSTSTLAVAQSLSVEDANGLISFLKAAFAAWGRGPENNRLWTALNLTLCMWLFRRLVLTSYSLRAVRLDAAMFIKCLMSVSATSTYVDWLVGRRMADRDRSPAYARLREIFAKRIKEETGKKISMPSPSWYSN